MHQSTNISISMIQSEPAYNPGDLVRSIWQPNYWMLLGYSKHRSSVVQEKSQNSIHKLLSEASACYIGQVLLSYIDHVLTVQDLAWPIQ